MSCLRYRKIKNPISYKDKGFYDKRYISIPCCRCAGCRKQKQNDWLVRSYYEYTSKPTSVFFVTLDFDDDHLPKYNGVPCFDSELMTNFFETLRKCSGLPKFRYLYSSDYGGFLERPHYHVAFLFDKGAVSLEDFEAVILYYWKYGYHENIQEVNPRYKSNPFKCFEYVCKYTVKDLNFSVFEREKNMPRRYRSLTQASVGYGAQALDPSEFNSTRFQKEGIVFFGVINRKYLLDNSVVYLDIRNNGVLVPFSIPRYYEMKLMYDYHYNCFEKKVHLPKNEYGKSLQEIRHNCHYLKSYSSFVNSRDYDITNIPFITKLFNRVFPDSCYNGLSWKDIVDDVLLDSDVFFDVCKFYDYLDFYSFKDLLHYSIPKVYELPSDSPGSRLMRDMDDLRGVPHSLFLNCSLGRYELQKSVISYYKYDLPLQALWLFKTWQTYINLNNAHFEDWLSREAEKDRLRSELKRQPYKKYYLLRKNFKFSKLNFKPYVPLCQSGEN